MERNLLYSDTWQYVQVQCGAPLTEVNNFPATMYKVRLHLLSHRQREPGFFFASLRLLLPSSLLPCGTFCHARHCARWLMEPQRIPHNRGLWAAYQTIDVFRMCDEYRNRGIGDTKWSDALPLTLVLSVFTTPTPVSVSAWPQTEYSVSWHKF